MKHIFAQLSKVTEQPDGTCIVRGRMTAEELDKSGEILDYAKSRPQIEKWRDETLARSNGKSQGNIRAMHGKVAAGITTNIYFDDLAKAVDMEAHITDLNEARKCVDGVYTGFSIGGGYADRWPDPVTKGVYRFVPELSETSIVDAPCVPSAVFAYVKVDGSSEMKKFLTPNPSTLTEDDIRSMVAAELAKLRGTTKAVRHLVTESSGVEHLPYTDDGGKPDHNLMGAAWAALHDGYRGNKYAGPDKDNAISKLKNVYEGEGMKAPDAQKADRAEFIKALQKRAQGRLAKGMWDVARLGEVLCSLAYMHSSLDDDRVYRDSTSKIPDQLRAALMPLKQIFIDLATEEVNELIREEEAEKAAPAAGLAKSIKEVAMATKSLEQLKKAAKNGLAAMGKHVEGAQNEHDKMDDHISKMEGFCKAVFGELEKSAEGLELKKGLVSSTEALRASHTKQGEHLDGMEDEMEELAESAAEDEDESSEAAKKSRQARMQKQINRGVKKGLQEAIAPMQKSNEETRSLMMGMANAFERFASGGAAPAPAPQLARTAVAVEKSADVTGVPAPAQVAPAAGTVVPHGPTLVKAIRSDGMPDPAYVDSPEARGGGFEKAAALVPQQNGDPFPKDGTMAKLA